MLFALGNVYVRADKVWHKQGQVEIIPIDLYHDNTYKAAFAFA